MTTPHPPEELIELVEWLRDRAFMTEKVVDEERLTQAADLLTLQASHIEKLKEALRQCRDKFAEYAELHRRKLGSDRPTDSAEFRAIIAKVERNRDMADMCTAALNRGQSSTPGASS